MNKNTWHAQQPKNSIKRFAPKWDIDTIYFINKKLSLMQDFIDIQYDVAKKYNVTLNTAGKWIEMTRRIMIDVANGLSIEEAVERDRLRRNQMSRKTANPNNLKLNSEVAAAIKKECAQSGVSQKSIAAKYGVSQPTVSAIVNGTRWSGN